MKRSKKFENDAEYASKIIKYLMGNIYADTNEIMQECDIDGNMIIGILERLLSIGFIKCRSYKGDILYYFNEESEKAREYAGLVELIN